MEKKLFVVSLLCLIVLIATPMVHANGPNNKVNKKDATKDFYKNLPNMKQKVTELHFYLHDIVSGPKPTNIPIAMANVTAHSPTYFGLIAAIDDPLTAGPNMNSGVIGRAQGLFASASLEKIDYHMTFNLVFTSGAYKDSTLSIVGSNPFMDEYREMAVVGGTGIFRLARGSALLKTLTYDKKTGDAVVEYNVIVQHY